MEAKHVLLSLILVLALAPAQAHPASAARADPAAAPGHTDGLRRTVTRGPARLLPALAASAASAAKAQGRGGFFTLTDYLTYNAATTVDARGGVHLTFYVSDEQHRDEPLGQPGFYTYCDGAAVDCSDGAQWTWLIQFDQQVNEVQVVATSDGRPRVLVRRNGNRAYEYNFYACEGDCSDPDRWAGVFVNEAAGVDLFNTELPQHSLALDAQERPRFVYSNGWGIGRPTALYYAFCDAADCTEPGSWQDTPFFGPIEYVTVTSDYATLVFDGDRPRVVTRLNKSGLPVQLNYHACDDGCEDGANWSTVELPYPGDQLWTGWDLALDAQGRPHLALYEPAPIDLYVGGKLYYAWCEADCSGPNARFEMVQVAAGEGRNVDLAIDARGRRYMVYDAGQRGVLATLWCDAGCTDARRWQRQVLVTTEELYQDFKPANPFHCNQEERAWLDAIPAVSFDDQDRLVVAYDVKDVSICYYTDPTRPQDPPASRVERIWWATRLDFFTRPGESGTPVEEGAELPAEVVLAPNYPNPFNPSTTFSFTLRQAGPARLAVYDLTGRVLAVLVDGVRPAGAQHVTWDAAGYPSGSYVYRLEAAGETHTRLLTLLK